MSGPKTEQVFSLANVKLPTKPYPGLRPFLDNESALLCGRKRQVGEVIERLRKTQFVAVIGGSGSGKSSLIRAGVIPKLRSYGIREAGDFWIPMVFTPGTNVLHSNLSESRHTPIMRFAWKFATLLKSRGSKDADAVRVDEVAAVFRQEAGLERIVDAYAEELAVPAGTNADKARLLFVIDQFEELFHKTNKDNEDGRLLVERVIDHFFKPHPHCYVVLTMRSEHLNDCAAYLELPDAINESFYLVRRLDDPELHEAIVGPVEHYLRLLKRHPSTAGTVPDAVAFEPRLIERIIQDVKAITHDSDHLPLLQHLLARLWEVASERSETNGKVPTQINWGDLERAVSACAPGQVRPLDGNTNVMPASLENWAEAAYRRRTREQQSAIDNILRELAYKDPNTGQYTQQRVNVGDCADFLGPGCTAHDLRILIEDGFIGSVNYLFWDDENLEQITLKVSHESFIRGWLHFRQLIDHEADRFEEFLTVFRKCYWWLGKKELSEFLLGPEELVRLQEVQLIDVIENEYKREDWFSFLLRKDLVGEQLKEVKPKIVDFLSASKKKQQVSKRFRGMLYAVVAFTFTVALVFLTLYLAQAPFSEKVMGLQNVSNLIAQTPLAKSYASVREAEKAVGRLLPIVDSLKTATLGDVGFSGDDRPFLFGIFDWIPSKRRQDTFLHKMAATVEPPINGILRATLTNALWLSTKEPNEASEFITPFEWKLGMKCTATDNIEEPGLLFLQSKLENKAVRRGIFIPDNLRSRPEEIVLLSGSVGDGVAGKCTASQIIFSIPRVLKPSILFDADMRYLLVSTEDSLGSSVALYTIDWALKDDGKGWDSQINRLTVITDDGAVKRVSKEAGDTRLKTLKTWITPGGITLSVDGERWRIISDWAQRLEGNPDDKLRPLKPAVEVEKSACQKLNAKLESKGQPGFEAEMYEDLKHCFEIKRRNPKTGPPPIAQAGSSASASHADKAPPASQSNSLTVSVFQKPTADDLEQTNTTPPPIASLQFGRYQSDKHNWYVGISGRYDGWIVLRQPAADKKKPSYVGAPWSTSALKALGDDILKHSQTVPVQTNASDRLNKR